MDNSKFWKLYYFVINCSKLAQKERWFLISLMSWQNNNKLNKEESFRVYPNAFKRAFDIADDFDKGIFYINFYGFVSCTENQDKSYQVTINWDKIDEFRTNYINNAKDKKQ